MKFQIKIIIAFSLVLALILFYLNTVVIGFLDSFKEDYTVRYLANKNFIEQKFQEYVKNVLLWEFLLVLSLMLILYKIIERMLKQERDYKEFLELILLTISHKFGNFLASYKGNIEILKIKNDEKALRRLEKSYSYLEEDFRRISDTITHFKNFSSNKEKINLKEMIEKTLSFFEINSQLKLNLNNVFIYANRQAMENIIFHLMENAVKYSKERIYIRLSKNMLAIRNDIYEQEKGSGIGLKITEALAKKQGFKLKHRAKEEEFITVLNLQ